MAFVDAPVLECAASMEPVPVPVPVMATSIVCDARIEGRESRFIVTPKGKHREDRLQKLRELCRDFPARPYDQHPLDNLAIAIFDAHKNDRYHQSTEQPEGRYGLSLDAYLVQHPNPDIKDLVALGPNERYIVNKILASKSSLLMVIGDLGIGKTRFARFLMNDILPALAHKEAERTQHCPTVIYTDFLNEGILGKELELLHGEVARRLCDKLDAAIGDFFDIEKEVTTVWDEILSDKRNFGGNPACDFIRGRVRELGRALNSDPAAVLERRIHIRSELREKGYQLQYLAGLLKYIRIHWFAHHEHCLIVLVDNIDPEPLIVQQAAKLVLKQLARLSDVRIVATARHTTFYQQFDDRGSEPFDTAPFCGAEPLDVLRERIDDFLLNPSKFENFVNADDLLPLTAGIRRLRLDAIEHDAFKSLFKSLAGHSIRRALLLAQHLLTNSDYDLVALGTTSRHVGPPPLHISAVLRAVMVGSGGVYRWTPAGAIENVFDVQEHRGDSHLIKLRILMCLVASKEPGTSVERMIGVMCGFNYRLDTICAALNEMMSEPKGLIWCDAVLHFADPKDMASRAHAKLFISEVGKGYHSVLSRRLEYVQEVMLDTEFDDRRLATIGRRWDYGKLQDRFGLLLEFVKLIAAEDKRDVRVYLDNYTGDDYRQQFDATILPTRAIAEGVRDTARRILDAAVASQRTAGGELAAFRDNNIAGYDDLISVSEEFERQFFR
jgi:hypothetical protein